MNTSEGNSKRLSILKQQNYIQGPCLTVTHNKIMEICQNRLKKEINEMECLLGKKQKNVIVTLYNSYIRRMEQFH